MQIADLDPLPNVHNLRVRTLPDIANVSDKLISVLPKNYRRIALAAIELAADPVVLMNGTRITDFSEAGPVTQKGIRRCRDFEVRDGSVGILGFHDHPNEMWVAEDYRPLADRCAAEGWLKVQWPAS